MAEAGDPGLPVATVARRMGVAPATLRTWDRRYGLGPSGHTAGSHRRYLPQDLERLAVMQRLLREGVSPREAAEHAMQTTHAMTAHPTHPTHAAHATPVTTPGDLPGPRDAEVPVDAPAADLVRGLTRAATELDSETVTAMIRDQIGERGVLGAWEQVLRPVLVAAGERWAATGRGVEVEHLLAGTISAVLQQTVQLLPTRSPVRPVLLANPPDELHALPQHALAAGLAERGVSVRMLGPAMPLDSLVDAVRRTGPSALFLWSQLPGTADPAVLHALPVTRPPTTVVLGGPGWTGMDLPPRCTHAASLGDALALVLDAAGH